MFTNLRDLYKQNPSVFYSSVLQSSFFRQFPINENGQDNDVIDEYMADQAVKLIIQNPDRIVALKTLALLANRATNKQSIIENFKYLLKKVFSDGDPRQQCIAIDVLSRCDDEETKPYKYMMMQSSDRWYPMAISRYRDKSTAVAPSEPSHVGFNSTINHFNFGGIASTEQPLMDIWKTVDVDQEVSETTLDRACFLLLRSDPRPSTRSADGKVIKKMGYLYYLHTVFMENVTANGQHVIVEAPAIQMFAALFFHAIQDSKSVKQLHPLPDAYVDEWVDLWKSELKKELKTTQVIVGVLRKSATAIGVTTADGVVLVRAAEFLESLIPEKN